MLIPSLPRLPDWRRFFRGEGARPAPHRTHSRNVYILPTRNGLFFVLILLLMLLGAINYSNSLGYLFTFLISSIAMVGMLYSYRNLLNLQVRATAVSPVFVGEPAQLRLIIHNPDPQPRYGLGAQLAGDNMLQTEITALPGDSSLHLLLPSQRRGRHPLPRVVLSSGYPLGLFRCWTHVHLQQSYLVYPAPAKVAPAPPASHYSPCIEGDAGRGSDDFAGLRNYQSGDSLKHVHWKALARQQVMLTKQFGGDRSDELWLDWFALSEAGVETRLSILSRWITDADHNGQTYGLRLPNIELKPDRGAAHRHHCLESLALFQTVKPPHEADR